ncbi:hypothetical protein B1F79_02520 [Coxiella-like endosymbiont of Rhipicephalus sanguineus]|nr:hypothetical protein [Coxiella-like endosymbiont of Rhipicephalus sanguineus]
MLANLCSRKPEADHKLGMVLNAQFRNIAFKAYLRNKRRASPNDPKASSFPHLINPQDKI